MVKSAGSGANTNTSMSSASSMNTGSNNNSVNGPRSANSFQTVSRGSNVAFTPSSGKALGNSQVSGETSYQTGVNQNASARKRAGNAAISRQQQKENNSSYQTANSQRTMQRKSSATAAEARRGNIVPQNFLNSFKRNTEAMDRDLPRNISGKIEEGLRNKPITREKLSKLQKLLNNGKRTFAEKQRREAAAEAKRKAAASAKRAENAKAKRTPIKSMKKTSQSVKAVASSRQAGQRSAALLSTRTTIPAMKELLIKQGVTNVNLGRSKAPYIAALEKVGISIGSQTPAAAGTASTKRQKPGTSSRLVTAAQGATAFLRNKQRLENQILSSGLNKNTQQKLTQKLQNSTIINDVRKNFNTLMKKPVTSGTKKSKKASALIKLYKSKITVRNRITKNREDDMSNQITKFNITTGRMSTNIKTTSDTFVNLLLIMWLDGIHDKYINMTFAQWLNHKSIQTSFPSNVYIKSPLFTFMKNLRVKPVRARTNTSTTPIHNRLQLSNLETRLTVNSPQLNEVLNGYLKWIVEKEQILMKNNPLSTSTFTERFINNLGFTPGSTFKQFSAGWEKNFKYFLIEKYREKKNIVENVERIQARDNNNIFLLAIDQEYSTRQERALTNMIIQSGESVQSLVTYGQAFDPGSTMLPQGIVPDLQAITVNVLEPEKQKLQPQPAIFSPKPWYYLEDYKFTVEVNGSSVMKINFNAQESVLTLNDKPLPMTISAGKAGKSNDPFFQLGKYFGDGLQYFIASGLTKSKPLPITLEGNNKKTVFHSFLGSGDGMALFGYDFVCTRLYKSRAPNMVIDFSRQSKPIAHIINFPSKLFTVKQVPVNKRRGLANNGYYDNNRSTQQAQTSMNTRTSGNTTTSNMSVLKTAPNTK